MSAARVPALLALTALAVLLPGPADRPAAAGPGGWAPPVPLAVAREFRAPQHTYGPGHRGVDLTAQPGAVVRSAAPGTVVLARVIAGVPVVVVAHGAVRGPDELRTTYQPVVASVEVGTLVARGSRLGRVGDWPGHCARSCLHWGLRRGTAYLDPLAVLSGPPRLLPAGPPVRAPVPRRSPAASSRPAPLVGTVAAPAAPAIVATGERSGGTGGGAAAVAAAVALATVGGGLVAGRRRRIRTMTP